MSKTKKKLINNRIVRGKEYNDLTLAAEKIVVQSIDSMIKKLCKLKHVEYFPWNEDGSDFNEDGTRGSHACEFNCDTAFREMFHGVIEDEVRKGLYKYG